MPIYLGQSVPILAIFISDLEYISKTLVLLSESLFRVSVGFFSLFLKIYLRTCRVIVKYNSADLHHMV